MTKRWTRNAALLSLLAILAGCSTGKHEVKVLMFAPTDYVWTDAGDTVGEYTTHTNGIWLSVPALIRLQDKGVIVGPK